jgi:hypothetical protein
VCPPEGWPKTEPISPPPAFIELPEECASLSAALSALSTFSPALMSNNTEALTLPRSTTNLEMPIKIVSRSNARCSLAMAILASMILALIALSPMSPLAGARTSPCLSVRTALGFPALSRSLSSKSMLNSSELVSAR